MRVDIFFLWSFWWKCHIWEIWHIIIECFNKLQFKNYYEKLQQSKKCSRANPSKNILKIPIKTATTECNFYQVADLWRFCRNFSTSEHVRTVGCDLTCSRDFVWTVESGPEQWTIESVNLEFFEQRKLFLGNWSIKKALLNL